MVQLEEELSEAHKASKQVEDELDKVQEQLDKTNHQLDDANKEKASQMKSSSKSLLKCFEVSIAIDLEQLLHQIKQNWSSQKQQSKP